jgi:glycosyltransferase involved in cell wall biosynthesis
VECRAAPREVDERPMRIVQLRSAQPELDPRVSRFSLVFGRSGWISSIVYWRRSGAIQSNTKGSTAAFISPHGFSVPPFWLMPFFLTIFYLRSLKLVLRFHPRLCVAHQLDTLPLALLLRRFVPELKIVFDREDIYSLMVAPDVPSIVRSIIYAVEYALASHADLSIFPNQATRDYAYQDDSTSLIIPNVPEAGFTPIRGSSARSDYDLKDKFSVIYFGAVTQHMGLETLVKAVASLNADGENIVGIIAGDGPMLEELKKIAANERGGESVRFLGRLDRSRIPRLLSVCDASAIIYNKTSPIMWMATPNKLFESMVFGIPIIASNFGMIARMVTEANCGLLADPIEPESVAEAIRKLSRDPSLRSQLSRNGIDAMRTKYSWERIEQTLSNAMVKLAPNVGLED